MVLVRDGRFAPELFLVHRHFRASFGASYVFPGGLLDAGDCEAPAFSGETSAEAADRCLGLTAGGLYYYCAAIREVFEEAGVLLAHRGGGRRIDQSHWQALQPSRDGLNSGALRWSEFLRRNDLTLACEALHYFAWWITPRGRPKRFSTRFFLAALPEGQEALHDGRELTDSRWTTARDAIRAFEARELVLPPPTSATLREIADLPDVDGLLRWADGRAREGVPRIVPAIVSRGGQDRVLLPDDPDYPPDANQDAQ